MFLLLYIYALNNYQTIAIDPNVEYIYLYIIYINEYQMCTSNCRFVICIRIQVMLSLPNCSQAGIFVGFNSTFRYLDNLLDSDTCSF